MKALVVQLGTKRLVQQCKPERRSAVSRLDERYAGRFSSALAREGVPWAQAVLAVTPDGRGRGNMTSIGSAFPVAFAFPFIR